MPAAIALHGPHPWCTTRSATVYAETPYSAVCASDTMPPYAARKIRLAAAIPSHSVLIATAVKK